MAKRYVASKRHTIQVDFEPYMRTIKRERRARRARPAAANRAHELKLAGDLSRRPPAARIPAAWRLRGAVGPAVRRGFLVAAPVAIALLAELEIRPRRRGGRSAPRR